MVTPETAGSSNAPIDVLLLITVWWVTFTAVVTLGLCLGFGPRGIAAGKQLTSTRPSATAHGCLGSFAAAFQGWAYGGFAQARGIFATLTSLGGVGLLAPRVAVVGASVATLVLVTVWLGQ